MTAQVQAMIEQAKRLTADERAELTSELLALADGDPLGDSELWARWRPELDRRRALLERGELKTVDAREHIESMRAQRRASGAK